ncbi:uncharacterized protein LOC108468738 [Gossypium arboreum]|uniref:uncharacterized protein LOC108468738 n=1 Tax=Gossypium arboreum TaxID=29729 RepID=UPI0008196526|nr:uncharacterized protein LOC108468738 [Gossypium arboreum]
MWSKKMQLEKGDSLAAGYISELCDFTCINVTQNEFQELRNIWASWDDETKRLFYQNFGYLPYLLDIKVDKHLFRAMAQFWNPAYSCFTFENVDFVPTVEEYTTLLHCPKVQVDRAYSKAANALPFVKKLMSITGMSEHWVTARIQQKGDGKYIPWVSLRDLIVAHLDMKKKVDVFALSIYGLVVFPKVLRHIDEAITDLFDRLDKRVTPVPKADRVSYRVLFENYSLLKEIIAAPKKDDILEENWIILLRNLQEDDVEWRALWLVPLPGIWGAVGYASLLILRQYRSRQFIPTTYELAQSEFSYRENNFKKKAREISDAWKQICQMKKLAVGLMTTPEYNGWLSKRINDNVPGPNLKGIQSMEEYLQVIPSELEIIKQNFKKRNSELGKKIK